MTMPSIYKIVVGNKMTVKSFIKKDATEICERLKAKGKDARVVLFRKNVKIYDNADTGSVEYYREEREDEVNG
jgi:hypothetical protein